MQPLYSVDHETRQNAHHAEEAPPSPAREETPLLHRFPQTSLERSPLMMVTVSLLLILLVTGVIIGIYLLVLQTNSENVLPPIETPLQLVSRKQWRAAAETHPSVFNSSVPATTRATQVIVLQTDTEPCENTLACAHLLRALQLNTTSGVLPYNFFVSSNGQTYEELGWHRASPVFPRNPPTLVLAFIGNFTDSPPTKLQIDEAKNFFAESISQQFLNPSYVVFGKNTKYHPTYLFNSLRSLPRWSELLTDH